MHIYVSTPFNLGVAYSCFGPAHQYFLVSVYKSDVRNKGRDYSAQNSILLELANRLHLEYRVISVQEARSLVLSNNGFFAVDYRVGEILPGQRLHREIYKNLILIVNGADFWQVLAPLTELLHGRKRARDFLLWKKTLMKLKGASFIFPGAARANLSSRLIPVSRSHLEATLNDVSRSLVWDLFPALKLSSDFQLLIINPEVSEFNSTHIQQIIEEVVRIADNSMVASFTVIKCHPATLSEKTFIEAVSSELEKYASFKANLKYVPILQQELFKAFPIEFLLFAFPDSHLIGFPTTASAVVDRSRRHEVMSGNPRLDSTWIRSSSVFRFLIDEENYSG